MTCTPPASASLSSLRPPLIPFLPCAVRGTPKTARCTHGSALPSLCSLVAVSERLLLLLLSGSYPLALFRPNCLFISYLFEMPYAEPLPLSQVRKGEASAWFLTYRIPAALRLDAHTNRVTKFMRRSLLRPLRARSLASPRCSIQSCQCKARPPWGESPELPADGHLLRALPSARLREGAGARPCPLSDLVDV